ncbi:MAG TPA: NAD(P)/FAD-dependent oxidoreductase [Pyrinomonadaceae bacterium]|nr:NAD(P)/FAD-dependent oxidoreductase [Pyrinomonadaceae bacterium]
MGEEGTPTVVIIGAGPAGLTAAYQLCKAGAIPVVLEQDLTVGGLAKTVNYKGFRFDIGGHRFYTKAKAASDIWREVLSLEDFKRRKRLSRIYYNKRFFHYPLRASSMLFNLGWWNGCLILFSYLRARIFPEKNERTFEQWVTNRFGKRLYRTFFKSYTEKIWGIPCDEITAGWAAQRIKGLSLYEILKDIFSRQTGREKSGVVKTLVNEFDYPRLGPGMMWEAMAEIIRDTGGVVRTDSGVERINWSQGAVVSVEILSGGQSEILRGTHFISSMPVRELVRKLSPAPPEQVLAAAEKLQYRDYLTVVLVVNRRHLFPDNWIYIHDPEVKIGRVQNFKNWSREMVPDPEKTCLGLEYFCFKGDGLWNLSDDELIELGKRELAHLGLIEIADVEEGTVVRVPKAYPVYDSTYTESLETVRRFFATLPNLQMVGRNGMHKYNNQDHSMMTGLLAAENILGANYDLWEVNVDQDYQEEFQGGSSVGLSRSLSDLASTQPMVPEHVRLRTVESAIEYET